MQIKIILVTGFLGSGKTTLLKNLLQDLTNKGRRFAVIQNEFAPSSIDGDILREFKGESADYVMRELNTGSIFCACLFSQFKDVLNELSCDRNLDTVIIEATGIADPIAVAQLLEDKNIESNYYLSQIISVVDAPRFMDVLSKITGVVHQIQVADVVLVNKIDLVNDNEITRIKATIDGINPLTRILTTSYAEYDEYDFECEDKARHLTLPRGELTKCGESEYVSKCYKSVKTVTKEKLDSFLHSLDENILRVKGYVTLDDGRCFIVQYVPGQIQIKESLNKTRQTELISIGYLIPNFRILE